MSDLKPSNTVDIGICDCDGNFLGWSGSAHKTVTVGEYTASPGYRTLKIKPGKWKIIVGAYHIMPQGVDVTYDIEFSFKGERLLFGDLHIHSTASDGKLSAYEIAVLAKKKNLDFTALANHNNYAENFRLPFVDGLTFVPAVEWTHYKGHMNFFGLEAPFGNSFVANSSEEMRELIKKVRQAGAIVSVNHPKCRFCPYLWEDEDAFDLLEVWNGPMRPTNMRALAYWTSLLKNGRQIPIVGGSDFHKPHHFAKLGNPVTGVYSASPSAKDIMKSVAEGKCFVAEKQNGIRLFISYGNAVMGQKTTYRENELLKIESNAEKVTVVTENGETTVKLKGGEAAIKLEKTKFVYILSHKGIGKFKKITAISNPIYFKEEQK